MIYHGAKLATNDIDIVFVEKSEADAFVECLRDCGFERVDELPNDYKNLEAMMIMEKPEGVRFDIFVRFVCGRLLLSEGMKERSLDVDAPGRLRLHAISPEDIFLFKSITARDDDLSDMASLAGLELDWGTIVEELRSQPEYWHWIGHHFEKLRELERVHRIVSPSMGELERDAEIATGMANLSFQLERGPLTVHEAIVVLGEDDEEFAKVVLHTMVEIGLAREEHGRFYHRG